MSHFLSGINGRLALNPDVAAASVPVSQQAPEPEKSNKYIGGT